MGGRQRIHCNCKRAERAQIQAPRYSLGWLGLDPSAHAGAQWGFRQVARSDLDRAWGCMGGGLEQRIGRGLYPVSRPPLGWRLLEQRARTRWRWPRTEFCVRHSLRRRMGGRSWIEWWLYRTRHDTTLGRPPLDNDAQSKYYPA